MAKQNNSNEPIEKQLWKRLISSGKNIDAAEYKAYRPGADLSQYISDAFEELFLKLKEGKGEYEVG